MISSERLGGLFGPLLKAAAAIALAAGLLASPASAATCSVSNVTTDLGLPALDCVANVPGGPGGNVTEAVMNGNAVFGKTGWTDFGKVDLPGTSGDFLEIGFDPDLKTGTWKLADGFSFAPGGHYALALKAGSIPGNGQPTARGKQDFTLAAVNGSSVVANVVYLLDISNRSGTWSTADLLNPGGNQPELSNITLFGTVAPIPLPAAAWLMIGGIAALGAVARKRRAPAA